MSEKNIENVSNFETLIEKNDIRYDDRWKPNFVSTYEMNLSQGLLKEMNQELRKNIAYSLQYLEYIELQLCELHLHNVIITMLYKTFIITGTSIIEGIFCYLLKSNNLWNQKEWELEEKINTNKFKLGNEMKKIELHIFKQIPKTNDEMNFDSMIKKVESKKLISIPHGAFPYIKMLRRLRNKVHLQIHESPNDTDWWSFKYSDYCWMKCILYIILTNKRFDLSKQQKSYYSFLKPTEDEIEVLKKDIKKSKEKIDDD